MYNNLLVSFSILHLTQLKWVTLWKAANHPPQVSNSSDEDRKKARHDVAASRCTSVQLRQRLWVNDEVHAELTHHFRSANDSFPISSFIYFNRQYRRCRMLRCDNSNTFAYWVDERLEARAPNNDRTAWTVYKAHAHTKHCHTQCPWERF